MNQDISNLFNAALPATVRKRLGILEEDDLDEALKEARGEVLSRVGKLRRAGLEHAPSVRGLEKKIEFGLVKNIPSLGVEQTREHKTDKQSKIDELMIYNEFLEKETSTVKGAREWEKDVSERIGRGYQDAEDRQKRAFWRLYDEQRNYIDELVEAGLNSSSIQKQLWRYMYVNDYSYVTDKRREFFEDLLIEARIQMEEEMEE